MPNWCSNELEIVARTRAELNDFINKYDIKDGYFDYDKIIPEPRTLEECPLDCVVKENSCIEIDEVRPWFDWYKWHIKYWGCKWNASDVSIVRNKCVLTIYFSSPWCEPTEVIKALKNQNPRLAINNFVDGEEF